jgi:hypothetical protein
MKLFEWPDIRLHRIVLYFTFIFSTIQLSAQTCVYVDFDFTIGANQDGCSVEFDNLSVGGDLASFSWEFGDGGIAATTSIEENPSHTYNESDCYFVKLTGTTFSGETVTETRQVCVNSCGSSSGGAALTATIQGPSQVTTAGTFIYSVDILGGVPPYNWYWDFDGGELVDPSATIWDLGPHQVEFPDGLQSNEISISISDSDGNHVDAFLDVSIDDTNIPFLDFEWTVAIKDQPVTFLSQYNPFAVQGIATEEWDFDDGTSISNSSIHTFNSAGFYNVTLTLCDYDGCSNSVTKSVQVYNNYSESLGFTSTGYYITTTAGVPGSGVASYRGGGVCPINSIGNNNILNSHIISNGGSSEFKFWVNSINTCQSGSGYTNWSWFNYPQLFQDGWLAQGLPIFSNFDLLMKYTLTNQETGKTIHITPEAEHSPFDNEYARWLIGSTYTHDFDEWGCWDLSIETKDWNFLTHQNTFNCIVYVEPNQVQIDNIEINDDCNNTCLKVNASEGARDGNYFNGGNCGSGNEEYFYQEYEWKARNVFDNSVLSNFLIGNQHYATVDRSHDYFQNFHGTEAAFLLEITVTDHIGNTDTHTELVTMGLPLRVNIPSSLTFCPGVTGDFGMEPLVEGGSGQYQLVWSGTSTDLGYLNFPSTHNYPTSVALEINTPNVFNPISYTLNVTDLGTGTNCAIFFLIEITVSSLEVTLDDEMVGCSSGEGFYPIEPTIVGGSAPYNYYWDPAEYLDDATSSNPIPILHIANLTQQNYAVTVTDNFGCSAVSNSILVEGIEGLYEADAGPDITVCNGDAVVIGNNEPLTLFGNGAGHLWYSDHPNFNVLPTAQLNQSPLVDNEYIVVETNLELTSQLNQISGTYTYTTQVVELLSGCNMKDDVQVTVRNPWIYEGYESEIHNGLLNQIVLAWDNPDENKLYSSNPSYTNHDINSGAVGPFTHSWSPSGVTETQGVNNIPTQAEFTLDQPEAYRVLHLADQSTGCRKEFRTNRYLPITDDPDLRISSTAKPNACIGEEVCFDIELHYHYGGEGNPPLLGVIPIIADIPSAGSTHNLQLTDPENGIYKATICETYTSAGTNTLNVEYEHELTTFGGSTTVIFEEQLSVIVNGGEAVNEFNCVYGDPIAAGMSFKGMNVLVSAGIPTVCNGVGGVTISTAIFSGVTFQGGDGVSISDGFEDEFGNLGFSPTLSSHAFINPCFYLDPDGLIDEGESKVEGVTIDIREDEVQDEKIFPIETNLSIVPNPFRDEIELSYSITQEGSNQATLIVNDITGKRVKVIFENKLHESGDYNITMSTDDLQPGVYFYHLTVDNQRVVKKAIKVN